MTHKSFLFRLLDIRLMLILSCLLFLSVNAVARADANTDAAWSGDDTYWQGPIIDVHSQVEEKLALETIIPLLDRAGVAQTLLSSRFAQPTSDVLTLAAMHPSRIVPAAKTKTKAFMKGKKGLLEEFTAELQQYDFRAMAEVIMWHAAKKKVGAGKATMQPDDPRLLPLMAAAREKGVPFIAHIEFADLGYAKSGYLEKFKSFLAANPDVSIGLIHMGQLNATDAALLLPAHPNLFFITSHCNPVTARSSNLPWTMMFNGEQFTPEWQALLLAYPDRFVLAFDNVFSYHWDQLFLPQVSFWRRALKTLPDEVAHSLAHGNAEKLWQLSPATLH